MGNIQWGFFTEEQKNLVMSITGSSNENHWAMTMWEHLEAQGLTKYDTKKEFNSVLGRFVVLGYMYHLFYWFAYDLRYEPEYHFDDFEDMLPIYRSEFKKGISWNEIVFEVIESEHEIVYQSIMDYYEKLAENMAKERGGKNTFDIVWLFMDDLYKINQSEDEWDEEEEPNTSDNVGFVPSDTERVHLENYDDAVANLIHNHFCY